MSGGEGEAVLANHRRARGQAAERPSWRGIAAGLARTMLRDAARDLEAGRGFLWWPVAFGLAAAIYFALPDEPGIAVALAPASIALVAVVGARVRLGRVPLGFALAALATLGFLAAKVEVELARTPALTYSRSMTLTGTVAVVEDRGSRGHRLRIRIEGLDPPPRDGMPEVVRVTVRGNEAPPLPGERIRLLARLGPPQAAVYPGGYDFARSAFFAGIGGVGFALGPVERLSGSDEGTAGERAAAAVERFRLRVSADIRAELSGDAGAIAAALIVGDRGAIDPDTDEAMRISGLSHILSISGLHMALVAACLYGGVRALLALIPWLALNLPIKAIAAVLALAGTLIYLVVAGLALPTQRSAVMIAVALTAVIVGRQPFSLRGVAIAALVVFLFRPDAVLDPGAQLSFAAVAALIAGFEALKGRRTPARDAGDVNLFVRLGAAAARWVGFAMLTTIIAGIATAPIALHHFNRAAPLGLVANLLATPLVSLVVMPAGLLAALAMPFGLDGWPLAAMGLGIDGMVEIARTVADWTPGGGTFGRPSTVSTLILMAGGLWICLWTGRARLPGFVLLLLGLALAPLGQSPDLVVAGDGRRALIRVNGGEWALIGRADDFETAIWLAAVGDTRRPEDPSIVGPVRCDREACVLFGAGNGRGAALAAVIYDPVAFADECPEVALLIAAVPAPDWCRAMTTVIDADELEASGARTYRIEAADRTEGIANGTGAPAEGTEEIAVGTGAPAVSTEGIANGTGAPAIGTEGIANGTGAPAIGTEGIANGTGALAVGTEGIANGTGAPAVGTEGIADEIGAPAVGTEEIAVGTNATTDRIDLAAKRWRLTETARVIPPIRRPFDIGAP